VVLVEQTDYRGFSANFNPETEGSVAGSDPRMVRFLQPFRSISVMYGICASKLFEIAARRAIPRPEVQMKLAHRKHR